VFLETIGYEGMGKGAIFMEISLGVSERKLSREKSDLAIVGLGRICVCAWERDPFMCEVFKGRHNRFSLMTRSEYVVAECFKDNKQHAFPICRETGCLRLIAFRRKWLKRLIHLFESHMCGGKEERTPKKAHLRGNPSKNDGAHRSHHPFTCPGME